MKIKSTRYNYFHAIFNDIYNYVHNIIIIRKEIVTRYKSKILIDKGFINYI